MSGNVFVSAVYAKAVKLLGLDLLVYSLEDEKLKLAKYYFSKEYGQFEYSHIEKKTYIQSWRKVRLRTNAAGEDSKGTKSTLYENLFLPYITKQMSILDFRCRTKRHAKCSMKKATTFMQLKFFHRKPGKDSIWVDEIRRDFRRIKTHIETVWTIRCCHLRFCSEFSKQ